VYRQVELPLELEERARGRGGAEPTLDERFDSFHAANPWVYEALEELTAQWVEGGGGRIGVKALFERLRWSSPRIANGEPFRLNNDFTSRYARLLRIRHPEWAAVFEVRRLRTAEPDE
jgi:hypothetical protein